MHNNRLSAITRWPLAPVPCIARADVDLGFAACMTRIVGPDPELFEIAVKAFRMRVLARDELLLMREEETTDRQWESLGDGNGIEPTNPVFE